MQKYTKLSYLFSKSLTNQSQRFIAVGDAIPKVKVTIVEYQNGEYKRSQANTDELFKSGKNVLVGYPGAFTPACTATHIPEYIKHSGDLKTSGFNKIYAVAVNDPFVLEAFAKQLNAQDKIIWIADGNADFTKKLDVHFDMSEHGMGPRSRRFSMVINDGKVIEFNDEKSPKMTDLSRVAKLLKKQQI